MEEEGRRVGPYLSDKENVQALTLACGRGMRVESFLEQAIKLSGRYPNKAFFLNSQCCRQHLAYTLTCLG
jgi:hypothetical protein